MITLDVATLIRDVRESLNRSIYDERIIKKNNRKRWSIYKNHNYNYTVINNMQLNIIMLYTERINNKTDFSKYNSLRNIREPEVFTAKPHILK